MAESLKNLVEIHIPRRFEIKGKVLGNDIEKIGSLETKQHVVVNPYSYRRVTGLVAEVAENKSIVFLPRKTTSNLRGEDVVVVPECASPEDLSRNSKYGETTWLRPKGRLAGEISLDDAIEICQCVRHSWREKFKFQEEVRSDTGVLQPGLRPPQIGALYAARVCVKFFHLPYVALTCRT
ncbi:MAG: hypothetical protein OXI60_07400, partial [Acidiferrobacterales bacterium]|nr:hypothetical protein [Acidiferrobacterales bacterium]